MARVIGGRALRERGRADLEIAKIDRGRGPRWRVVRHFPPPRLSCRCGTRVSALRPASARTWGSIAASPLKAGTAQDRVAQVRQEGNVVGAQHSEQVTLVSTPPARFYALRCISCSAWAHSGIAFSLKKTCSPALKTKSSPQFTHFRILSVNSIVPPHLMKRGPPPRFMVRVDNICPDLGRNSALTLVRRSRKV